MLMVELTTAFVIFFSFYIHSRIAPMGLGRLNLISFTFYAHLLLAGYIGSYFILKSDAYFNVVVGEVKQETEYLVWAWLSYALIVYSVFFYLGMLATLRKKNLRKQFIKYMIAPVQFDSFNGKASDTVKVFFFSMVFVIFFANLIWGTGVGHFMSLVTSNPEEIFRSRTDATMGFTGIVIFKNVGLLFTPFFCYYVYLLRDISKFHDVLFKLIFLFTFIYLFYDLAKSPVIALLLGFLFLQVYTGRVIKLWFFISFFSLIILIFIGIYSIINDNIAFTYLFSPFEGGLTGRILISQISSFYRHLEIFPSIYPHIGFSSLSSFIGLEHQERSARLVLEHVLPSWVANGYGDQLNTIYLGEAWANFGLVGLILSPVWVGFLKGSTVAYLTKLKKTPITVAVLTVLSIRTSLNSGINDYIYNSIFWAFCFTIVVIASFVRTLRK